MQGQVLTVDFQPLPESSSDGVPSDAEASVPGTPRSYSDGGRRSDVSGSSSDRAPGTPGPATGRSRSPAAGRQQRCRVARATVPGHGMIVCSPAQWSRDMWVWGLFQHAQRTGAPGFTSVYLHLICGLGLLVIGLLAVWFLGSPFAFLCLHCVRSRPCRIDLLAVCLCFLCTVSWHPKALAMQTVARPSLVPGRGSLKSAPVGRPVPTPCRTRQHAALRAAQVYVMTTGDVSDSESEVEGCLDKPPVRRFTAHEPQGFLALDRDEGAGGSDPDSWLDTEQLLQATLLRLASARGDCTAFAVAVALLDVLFEAFPPDAAPPVQRIVSLEESAPITSFQRQALGLQALLPIPLPWCQPTDLVDWLDRDLRMLCGDGQVPANKRALFRQVVSWHGRAAELTPRRVLVYTDGSATPVGEATDIAPGAWAVSVWIESAEDSREYLLGCAADVMVTTDDFRFIGAHSDSPLECEQVALVWGLAWIIQYGAALQLPVVIRYDCQAAGLGPRPPRRQGWHSHPGCPSFCASCVSSPALEPCLHMNTLGPMPGTWQMNCAMSCPSRRGVCRPCVVVTCCRVGLGDSFGIHCASGRGSRTGALRTCPPCLLSSLRRIASNVPTWLALLAPVLASQVRGFLFSRLSYDCAWSPSTSFPCSIRRLAQGQ